MNDAQYNEMLDSVIAEGIAENGLDVSPEEVKQQVLAEMRSIELSEKEKEGVQRIIDKGHCPDAALSIYQGIGNAVEEVAKEMGITLT